MNTSLGFGLVENVTTENLMTNTSTLTSILDTHTTHRIIEDAVFANDSLITSNWTQMALGCLKWKPPNHTLFQVLNVTNIYMYIAIVFHTIFIFFISFYIMIFL